MRKIIFLLFLCMILSGCGVLRFIQYYPGYAPDKVLKEGTVTSFIVVSSEPKDAEVYIGNKIIGKTPVTLPVKIDYSLSTNVAYGGRYVDIKNIYINDVLSPNAELKVKKKIGGKYLEYNRLLCTEKKTWVLDTSKWRSKVDLLRHQSHFALDENIEDILVNLVFEKAIQQYYPDGKLMLEINYKDNKRQGIYRLYYWNGELMIGRNYERGKIHGIAEEYYENGKLMAERNYKDGKLEGVTKEYYWTGKLKSEKNYKDNKLEGMARTYYPWGRLKLKDELNYKDNKLDGVNKRYMGWGLWKKRIYKSGKLNGVSESYDPDGGKAEFIYKDDQLELMKVYRRNGTLSYSDTYKNGKKVSRKRYDKRGEFISDEVYNK